RFNVVMLTTRNGRVGTPGFQLGVMSTWSVLLKVAEYPRWLKHDSIADCSQIWTVSLFSGSHCFDALKNEDIARVNQKMLGVFTGETLPPARGRAQRSFPFELGEVLQMTSLDAQGNHYRRWYLVVSSPKLDAIRRGTLGHCTVVRLMPTETFDPADPQV